MTYDAHLMFKHHDIGDEGHAADRRRDPGKARFAAQLGDFVGVSGLSLAHCSEIEPEIGIRDGGTVRRA